MSCAAQLTIPPRCCELCTVSGDWHINKHKAADSHNNSKPTAHTMRPPAGGEGDNQKGYYWYFSMMATAERPSEEDVDTGPLDAKLERIYTAPPLHTIMSERIDFELQVASPGSPASPTAMNTSNGGGGGTSNGGEVSLVKRVVVVHGMLRFENQVRLGAIRRNRRPPCCNCNPTSGRC